MIVDATKNKYRTAEEEMESANENEMRKRMTKQGVIPGGYFAFARLARRGLNSWCERAAESDEPAIRNSIRNIQGGVYRLRPEPLISFSKHHVAILELLLGIPPLR